MNKNNLEKLIVEALSNEPTRGGSIIKIAKYIWDNNKEEIEASGNLLYTWQYDMRWAAHRLRGKGILKGTGESPNGIWQLN